MAIDSLAQNLHLLSDKIVCTARVEKNGMERKSCLLSRDFPPLLYLIPSTKGVTERVQKNVVR
jgi:hypothetical protein